MGTRYIYADAEITMKVRVRALISEWPEPSHEVVLDALGDALMNRKIGDPLNVTHREIRLSFDEVFKKQWE